MKGLTRQDKTYSVNNLPKLKYRSFNWQGQICYTGSMIERDIRYTFYKHYGLIYGYDFSGTLWVLENNSNGVECVTMRDFMRDYTYFRVKPNLDKSLIPTIIKRAKTFSGLPYNARLNNCESFVNYCLYGQKHSVQTEITESIANVVLTAFESYLSTSDMPEMHKVIDRFGEMRKKHNLPRPPEVESELKARRDQIQFRP